MQTTYRAAKPEDAKRICEINNLVFSDQNPTDLEYFYNRFNYPERFDTDFIVAEIKENVVGFAELSASVTCFDRGTPNERTRVNGFLWNLAVLPDFQNKGIGSELLRMSENWTQEHNREVLELEVQESKPETIKFYKERGYEQTARIPCEVDENVFYMLQFQKAVAK